MEENYQNIIKSDFEKKAENLNLVLQYQEDFFNKVLIEIKLAFLAFIGVILTIILGHREEYSFNFLLILISILLFLFILLIIELCINYNDVTHAIEKQSRRTVLAKIRHIGSMTNEFEEYGKRAEQLLIQEDKITQQMLNKESISDILKQPKVNIHTILLMLWLVALIAVPTLFLFEIL